MRCRFLPRCRLCGKGRRQSLEFARRGLSEEERAKLNDTIAELIERNRKLQDELRDYKATAENGMAIIKELERRAVQANSEKHDLELLLARINSCLTNGEMQKTVADMLKLQRELHSISEEKDKVEERLKSLPNINDQQRIIQLNAQGEKIKLQLGKLLTHG